MAFVWRAALVQGNVYQLSPGSSCLVGRFREKQKMDVGTEWLVRTNRRKRSLCRCGESRVDASASILLTKGIDKKLCGREEKKIWAKRPVSPYTTIRHPTAISRTDANLLAFTRHD